MIRRLGHLQNKEGDSNVLKPNDEQGMALRRRQKQKFGTFVRCILD